MKPYYLPLLLATTFAACTAAPPPAAPVPETAPGAPGAPATSAGPKAPAAPADRAAPTAPADAAALAPAAAPAHWWLDASDAASPGAGVEAAYALLAGKAPKRTVVVGVIDSGVDTAHVDLRANLWTNAGEVPGNGVDDDHNGYVDDVHGWDFIGGPDGDVNEDTYEVTRLYAACQAMPAGSERVVAGDVPCAKIDSAFSAQRDDTQRSLLQVRNIAAATERAEEILRGQLGGDSLTVDAVRGIVAMRGDVRQAQQIYLQLAAAGITPKMVADEQKRLEGALAHSLNPDFNPRTIVGDDYADLDQRDYGNNDVTGPTPGHGTGVAGIIAAIRGNGLGQDGIAPSARIMIVRTVPEGDERDKDVANAIRYAVDNGANVINMSFGKGYSPGKSAVDAAVRYAESHGVLLVHAAGNEGDNLAVVGNYPNRYYAGGGEASNWIEVGASGWQGREGLAAPFSNYGRAQVDVFAPGVSITTTAPGNDYQTGDGTSFAAPVVTGVAALIMAYYPELTAVQVRRIILESARPYGSTMVGLPGSDGEKVRFGELSATGGIVDARAALELAAKVAAGGAD